MTVEAVKEGQAPENIRPQIDAYVALVNGSLTSGITHPIPTSKFPYLQNVVDTAINRWTNERNRRIVRSKFGLDTGQPASNKQLEAEFGLSRGRIGKIVEQSLNSYNRQRGGSIQGLQQTPQVSYARSIYGAEFSGELPEYVTSFKDIQITFDRNPPREPGPVKITPITNRAIPLAIIEADNQEKTDLPANENLVVRLETETEVAKPVQRIGKNIWRREFFYNYPDYYRAPTFMVTISIPPSLSDKLAEAGVILNSAKDLLMADLTTLKGITPSEMHVLHDIIFDADEIARQIHEETVEEALLNAREHTFYQWQERRAYPMTNNLIPEVDLSTEDLETVRKEDFFGNHLPGYIRHMLFKRGISSWQGLLDLQRSELEKLLKHNKKHMYEVGVALQKLFGEKLAWDDKNTAVVNLFASDEGENLSGNVVKRREARLRSEVARTFTEHEAEVRELIQQALDRGCTNPEKISEFLLQKKLKVLGNHPLSLQGKATIAFVFQRMTEQKLVNSFYSS